MINKIILAIDPGNTESGYAVIQMPDFKLIKFGKLNNGQFRQNLFNFNYFYGDLDINEVVIERVASYGMAVGKDVFETCEWIGIFTELLSHRFRVNYIYRKDEKMTLCGSMKAKDSNIRQELINRYAKHDFKNGKGVKKNPDTFYGVSKDVWQAIAVGVTYWELEQEKERNKKCVTD